MKNIAEKLDQINKQSEIDKAKFDQLVKFEETLHELQKIAPLSRPTYILPQVDTIGSRTYSLLNKK
jgi:hypothetical protein